MQCSNKYLFCSIESSGGCRGARQAGRIARCVRRGEDSGGRSACVEGQGGVVATCAGAAPRAAAAARRRLFIINFGPVTSDGRRISRCNLISVQCLLTLTKASFRNFWVSFKLILILLECFVFCVTTLSYLNFTT